MEVLVTIHSSDVPVVAMGTMVVDWVNFFAQIVDAELPRGSERKVLLDTCLALTEYIASREEGFVFAPAVCAAGAVVAASYFLLTECREKVLNTLAREAGSAPSVAAWREQSALQQLAAAKAAAGDLLLRLVSRRRFVGLLGTHCAAFCVPSMSSGCASLALVVPPRALFGLVDFWVGLVDFWECLDLFIVVFTGGL
mmetsp:Transcript_368/g.705  ORF Transcript_368/g.705 Transcript_368/m.705 type:complete len:197 (-) Transcript_368:48-638(-)